MPTSSKPHVIIIGAGFTGCATAHDLALRGCQVTVLERGDLANGTSGRTHGLLHSGGRYCVNDPEAAIECIDENIILRKIAKQCIEFNEGFFVALSDEDERYAHDFAKGAVDCRIPAREIPVNQALQMEPNLNPAVRSVWLVPDGAFDPLRLAMAFAASARVNSAKFLTFHEVTGLPIDGQGKITGVECLNRHSNEKISLSADLVVNATGAWAGKIAALAGVKVPVIPTPGVMVAFDKRFTNRVINRMTLPADGDILIPQRRMSVIGTTSFEVQDVDYIPVDEGQVQEMIQCAAQLVPAIKTAQMRGAYMSARPLIGQSVEGRSLSRTFKCYDHAENGGLQGMVTITGGKATSCRAMAEKTADIVCGKLGISAQCSTRETVLASYREYYR